MLYITLGARRWKVVFETRRGQLGECDPPTNAGKKIQLDPHPLRSEVPARIPMKKARLWVALHEAFHAIDFNLSEESVHERATELVWYLDRLEREGYLPSPEHRECSAE